MSEGHSDQLDKVDEFEEFDHEEFEEAPPPPKSFKDRMFTMWRDNPGFKMLVILGVGAVVLLSAYLFMNSSPKPTGPSAAPSRVAGSDPNVKGNVGANVTPEYKKILEESNKKTAEEALKNGTSAISTPVGNVVDSAPVKKEEPVDPLAMWRQAEQKPLPQPTTAPAPVLAPVNVAPTPQVDASQQQAEQQLQQQQTADMQQMTQAMQSQITALTQAWGPTSATVINFAAPSKTTSNGTVAPGGTPASATSTTTTTTTTAVKTARVVVPAGDIQYGTMITEANSDVPGPILAQIVSGPLQGGRVIGAFTSTDSYLILRFTTLSIGGHSYAIDAIALDPTTTLGAVATETDQRYFARLVLPAAAAFISQFGQAISTPSTTTSQSASSTVTTTQPSSTQNAIYAGLGQSAQQLSSFVNAAGNQVKPLVRVASSTAIGIFFVKPVTDKPQESAQ